MNIIAVDDEKLSLEALVSCIKENLPNETVNAFRKTSDAEVYVCRNGCDIAFLDIEMRDVNGIRRFRRSILKSISYLLPVMAIIRAKLSLSSHQHTS